MSFYQDFRRTFKKIYTLQLQQIDELFTSFSELLERSKVEEPTLIELTAIGSILHSFYNGKRTYLKQLGKILMVKSLVVTIGIANS